MPPIRLEATGELAGNWIDLSDVWTRGEIKAWYESSLAGDDAVWLPILQRKLAAVHVRTVSGELIEDAAMMTQRLDDLDVRVVRGMSAGIMRELGKLLTLGEAWRRHSSDGVEVEPPTMTKTKTPT